MTGSPWRDGQLQPGRLCPFCTGAGAFIHIKRDRIAWYDCRACDAQGASVVCAPKELRIGGAQGKFLKQHPPQAGD